MKDRNIEEFYNTNQETPFSNEERRPSLTIDVDYYRKFLEDEGISEQQKTELIETLWSIITSVIGFGFGVHPLQQTENEDMKHAVEAVAKLVSSEAAEIEIQHASECKETKKKKGELREEFRT